MQHLGAHARCGAGAHRTWFHLLGLLIEQPSRSAAQALPQEEQEAQLSQLAVAIEQFLQSATLGEFALRLRLLSTFERHVQAQVRASLLSLILPCIISTE